MNSDDQVGVDKPSETIHTRSTSLNTAETDPVVLRVTSTTRLVFKPTLIEVNPQNPAATVKGVFTFQRKAGSSTFLDDQSIPLSKLRSGEGVKIELNSAETQRLFNGLLDLYELVSQRGVARGTAQFAKLPVSPAVQRLLEDPQALSNLFSDPNVGLFQKFSRWLAGRTGKEAVQLLKNEGPDDLAAFNAVLSSARLRQLWTEIHSSISSDKSEGYWQRLLSDHSWVITQLFAHPCVIVGEQIYVGGKRYDNRGGNLADFLLKNELTGNAALVEIKTPQTKLLSGLYRNNAYAVSRELTGATVQSIGNKRFLQEQYRNLQVQDAGVNVFDPSSLLIIGNITAEGLNADQKRSFELYRQGFRELVITTFDELDSRISRMIRLLEGRAGA
jgi:hypothetical protein